MIVVTQKALRTEVTLTASWQAILPQPLQTQRPSTAGRRLLCRIRVQGLLPPPHPSLARAASCPSKGCVLPTEGCVLSQQGLRSAPAKAASCHSEGCVLPPLRLRSFPHQGCILPSTGLRSGIGRRYGLQTRAKATKATISREALSYARSQARPIREQPRCRAGAERTAACIRNICNATSSAPHQQRT
eukprot:354442-Chlamydomonas_euryale.AAC.2